MGKAELFVAVQLTNLCKTLCDPMDCSTLGSFVLHYLRVCSNSCPLSQWCYLTISSSAPAFSFGLQSFPASAFSSELGLHIRWPKYWSFSFSSIPSKEIPGLISYRMDWLDILAVQGTQESSPTPQLKSINSSALSFLHSPTLTSIPDHWKNHSLD